MTHDLNNPVHGNSKNITGIVIFFIVAIVAGFFLIKSLISHVSGFLDKSNSSNGTESIEFSDPLSDSLIGRTITFPPKNSRDHIAGSSVAKVTMFVYTDLECIYCAQYNFILQKIIKNYTGKVNLIFRHAPNEQLHPGALVKAQGAECAGEIQGEGGFWKYIDYMFSNQALPVTQMSTAITALNIDSQAFDVCMQSKKYEQLALDGYHQVILAGGDGTPFTIIEDGVAPTSLNGAFSYEDLVAILDPLVKD